MTETQLPKKQKWTQSEDELLKDAVKQLGTKSWKSIAVLVPGRNGKQCRERWLGQLAPSVIKEDWTQEEDDLLINGQKVYGNKWSKIARQIKGRSSTSVKNRWNWLARHGIVKKPEKVMFSQPYLAQLSPQTIIIQQVTVVKPDQITKQRKVTDKSKANWEYLSPIEFDDSEVFGAGFVKFQESLNII